VGAIRRRHFSERGVGVARPGQAVSVVGDGVRTSEHGEIDCDARRAVANAIDCLCSHYQAMP